MNAPKVAVRIAAVLWFVWGAVHMLAGVMTMLNPPEMAFGAIADAVDPTTLAMAYPDAVGAVLNQHGWNLAWGGLWTIVCSPFVWKGDRTGIVLAASVGGLLDLGYFLFLDLGGFVNVVPGTIMTILSGSAIVLSAYAVTAGKTNDA